MSYHGSVLAMNRDEFRICLGKLFRQYPALKPAIGANAATLRFWFERLEPYPLGIVDNGLRILLSRHVGTPSLDTITQALDQAKQTYQAKLDEAERDAHFADRAPRREIDVFWARFNTKILADGLGKPYAGWARERQRRFELLADHCPELANDALDAAAEADREARELAEACRLLDPEVVRYAKSKGIIDGSWEQILPTGFDDQPVYPPASEVSHE